MKATLPLKTKTVVITLAILVVGGGGALAAKIQQDIQQAEAEKAVLQPRLDNLISMVKESAKDINYFVQDLKDAQDREQQARQEGQKALTAGRLPGPEVGQAIVDLQAEEQSAKQALRSQHQYLKKGQQYLQTFVTNHKDFVSSLPQAKQAEINQLIQLNLDSKIPTQVCESPTLIGVPNMSINDPPCN